MNEIDRYNGQIIEPLGGYNEYADSPEGMSIIGVIKGTLRHWVITLVVSFTICLIGIPSIWLLIEPKYEIVGAIRVAPILPKILTGEADKGEIANYNNFVNTQAEIFKQSMVVERVADDLSEKNLKLFETEKESLLTKLGIQFPKSTASVDIAGRLKGMFFSETIIVSPIRHTELIQIKMISEYKEDGKKIIDAFIRAYMAIEGSSSLKGQNQQLTVLEEERRMLEEKLESQGENIQQLAQEYGTVTLDSRQDMMLQRVSSLLQELTKLESMRINLEAKVKVLEKEPNDIIPPQQLLMLRREFIDSDPTVQVLTANIAELDQAFIVAKQTYTETNPELKRQELLIKTLRERLENRKEELSIEFDDMIEEEVNQAGQTKLATAKAELEQVKAHEQQLRETLNSEDSKTIGIGRKHLMIQNLQHQYSLTTEYYNDIRKRIQELEIERKRPARITVASYADVEKILDRRLKLTAALLFFAFAGGLFLAFMRFKIDSSLHTPEDITKRVGIRIIGTTTRSDSVARQLLPQQLIDDYQTIRANIGLMNEEGIPRKIAIVSACMREGKTTFSINLATSIAKSGKKVLLIDGDLRKPDIVKVLGVPKGMTNIKVLLNGTCFEKGIYSVPATGLDVLAPEVVMHDAYELLAMPVVAENFEKLSHDYDHVIVDTPPILAFPDALIWSKMTGNVILTSFAGQTAAPDLKDAKQKLVEINVKILGTVLSNVNVEQSYYRYGYNYYQDRGKNKRKGSKEILLLSHGRKENNNKNEFS